MPGVARKLRDALEIQSAELDRPGRRPGPAWLLNPRRLEIVLAAAAYPGLHLRSASRLLLSPLPTLRYHVKILEAHRLLAARRRGSRVHLFLPSMFPEPVERFLEAWQDPEGRRVLAVLREGASRGVSELADATRIPLPSVRRLASRLAEQGAIRGVGARGESLYRLSPAWRAFERLCLTETLERLERFLAILRADDLHPVVESQDGDRARIVVDGRRFRIRFVLPLNPLG